MLANCCVHVHTARFPVSRGLLSCEERWLCFKGSGKEKLTSASSPITKEHMKEEKPCGPDPLHGNLVLNYSNNWQGISKS